MDELHQRVVTRIREIARERRIAITHLPDRASIGRSHFWEVMAGRSSPTLAWLGHIATALEVDAGELVVAKRSTPPATGRGRQGHRPAPDQGPEPATAKPELEETGAPEERPDAPPKPPKPTVT